MASIIYPIGLEREQIEALLPHRGEMLFVQTIEVLAHNHFRGTAYWYEDSAAMQGHFPNMPIVPGVFLIEAVAQLAGAGMLAGDPHAQSMRVPGNEHLGVLAAVKKCTFKQPLLPHQTLDLEVRCRQMAEKAVLVCGSCTYAGAEVAQIEVLIVNAPLVSIQTRIRGG